MNKKSFRISDDAIFHLDQDPETQVLEWMVISFSVAGVTLLSLFGVPLIYPYPLFVYIFDVISGFPIGILWSTVGGVVGQYSDVTTLDRNTGIVFLFYKLGPTIGNLVVFFCFNGQTEISDKIRYITISTLCAIGFLSPFLMLFFGKPKEVEIRSENEANTECGNAEEDPLLLASGDDVETRERVGFESVIERKSLYVQNLLYLCHRLNKVETEQILRFAKREIEVNFHDMTRSTDNS